MPRNYGAQKYAVKRNRKRPFILGWKKQRIGKGMRILQASNAITNTPLLPLKKYGKLTYYDQNNFSTGAVQAGGYVFTANGLYDPNITGTGHQPMGFDQMMLFYEHYTVTKATLTVNFYNNDVDDPVIVGCLIAPDVTIETNFSKLVENGMLNRYWITEKGGNDPKHTFKISADISKINGKKDVKSEDDFRGDSASNPVEQSYFHLFAYNQTNVNVVNVLFEVVIEYEAVFTEPRKMIQS